MGSNQPVRRREPVAAQAASLCGGTLLELLDNTVPLRSRPEQSVRFLARAVKNAQGVEGMRGEASDFADQVLASL